MSKSTEPVETDRSPLLTVSYVAHRLNVDPGTVRRWIKRGTLEAVALPGSQKASAINRQFYRIKQSTLNSLLATGEGELIASGEDQK